MPESPILTAERLLVGYGDTPIIPQLDLSVSPGELVGLIGANGAGKSTLLRTLSGSQSPLGGQVMVAGKPLDKMSPRSLARLIAIVYTDRITSSGLTVRQVVALGRHPHISALGRLGSTDRDIVNDAISTVGIEGLADKYVSFLSDGERQKVMIARALAQQTPIIMLDEPTTFLDIASRLEMFRLLHRLATGQRKAIIISTHDVAPLLNVATRVLMITADHQLIDGTPGQLTSSGEINLLFPSEAGITYSPALHDFVIAD